MFTKTRCNIYFAVLVSLTYLFILSNNLIFSTFIWILSGVLVYIFSYFDVFKTGADYDTNRFYSIFLTGDFCLILYCLIFLKYTIISGNYSYALNFSDLKIISSYLFANSNTDYIIAPIALCGALFSRAFIFPFSSFFSFLSNASNWFYMTIYCVFSQLYALILFLKTDMFNYLDSNFKILLIILVVINIFLLLFEKDFKIIFGYLLSIANTSFIVVYFANPKISFVYLSACYAFLVSLLALLFLKNMTSFNGRLIKTNGFIQERILLYLFKDFPYKIANIFEITGKITVTSFLKLSGLVVNTVGYHYTVYVQNRKISSVLKGIVTLFALFALLAIFIALFGNFGEMQI